MVPSRYIGKAEYCYANSAAMLLASIGENIRPETIEVACGIGLSAFIEAETGNLFFSPFVVSPDAGLDRALAVLGFGVDNSSFDEGSALAGLRDLLRAGPVVIGPIDMGYLAYNPFRVAGADHFVLVYGADGDEFLLHDPSGYPCMRLAASELLRSWRAEAIGYKKDSFQYWYAPRRISWPGEEQIRRAIWDFFKEIYAGIAALRQKGDLPLGADAIGQSVDALAAGTLAVSAESFLTDFQLPLAAKRAADYGALLAPSYPEFADCKLKLAAAFGRAHSRLAVGDKAVAAESLKIIASLEERVAGLLA